MTDAELAGRALRFLQSNLDDYRDLMGEDDRDAAALTEDDVDAAATRFEAKASRETETVGELAPLARRLVAEIDDLVDVIDDDVPDRAKDQAPEFFESVRDKLLSIRGTVTHNGIATPRQISAVDGMGDGVRKWLNRGGDDD